MESKERSSKNFTVTLLLNIFLGYLGMHRFYLGHKRYGSAMFIFFSIGLGTILYTGGDSSSWFLRAGEALFGFVLLLMLGDIITLLMKKMIDGEGKTVLP